MKVYIKTGEGKKIRVPVPLVLIRLGLSLGSIGAVIARNFVDEQTRNYLDAVDFGSLSHCFRDLKRYKGLRIVDVKSASGEEVVITI